jgi:DNA-binding response OmpR family regulator
MNEIQNTDSWRQHHACRLQKKKVGKSGYEAEITIDEPGARKLLKKESFDLVLTDVRLPEGDGISLLEWMRRNDGYPFHFMTDMLQYRMLYKP